MNFIYLVYLISFVYIVYMSTGTYFIYLESNSQKCPFIEHSKNFYAPHKDVSLNSLVFKSTKFKDGDLIFRFNDILLDRNALYFSFSSTFTKKENEAAYLENLKSIVSHGVSLDFSDGKYYLVINLFSLEKKPIISESSIQLRLEDILYTGKNSVIFAQIDFANELKLFKLYDDVIPFFEQKAFLEVKEKLTQLGNLYSRIKENSKRALVAMKYFQIFGVFENLTYYTSELSDCFILKYNKLVIESREDFFGNFVTIEDEKEVADQMKEIKSTIDKNYELIDKCEDSKATQVLVQIDQNAIETENKGFPFFEDIDKENLIKQLDTMADFSRQVINCKNEILENTFWLERFASIQASK